MRFFLISLTLFFATNNVKAQSSEDAVKTTVNNLFIAMKNGDSILLASCFAENAIMQTVVKTKEGIIKIENESVADFINFIGHEPPGNADERITIETIKIDGPLSMVWSPYQFYYKGKFSHCGIDSFQLIDTGNGWKIQYLIDTRKKDCK